MVYFAIFLSSMLTAAIITYAAVVLYDTFPEKDEDVEQKED